MGDVPIDSIIQWIPTPLLALGFWALMKKAFNDHEKRFEVLVKRFEVAMEQQNEHNLALALLKREQDSQAGELVRLRDRHHELTNRFMEMQSQVIVRLLEEGSGPRRDPRSGHHNG